MGALEILFIIIVIITIDYKLRWDSHRPTDNIYKTVSRRVFLLSKLKYLVNMDTCFSVPTLKLTLIMRRSSGTDVAVSSKTDQILCTEDLYI